MVKKPKLTLILNGSPITIPLEVYEKEKSFTLRGTNTPSPNPMNRD